jgi:TIR domain-containing protein
MAGVFISYRRSDSDVAAGRLADDLMEIFGRGAIFRDVDTLEPGEDYTTALDHALDSCGVLIAVIGSRWSNITDDVGRRRLEDPTDWVRTEIRRALERGIRVIPVLISATMPQEKDIPADLKPLLKRQALEVSDRHWKQDVDFLAEALEKVPGVARQAPSVETSKVSFLAEHWVQLVLGFSVSVVVGLAPYLGKFIPLFTPMLDILPEAVQPVAIPLSAAAMGIVGVLVQWQVAQKVQPEQMKTWFRRTLLACVISLTLLAGIETIAVVRVDVPAVNRSVSFAIGPSHPSTPPCAGLSRADCIKHQLSLDEASIDSYFGEGWVNVTKFVLVIVYTVFMSTFGALVVMLAREAKLKFTRILE